MTKILRKVTNKDGFIRRKIEVWFVLLIVIAGGVLGRCGLERNDATNAALCRFAASSADTKDYLVTVIGEEAGLPDDYPALILLHAAIDDERDKLRGHCPIPDTALPTPITVAGG